MRPTSRSVLMVLVMFIVVMFSFSGQASPPVEPEAAAEFELELDDEETSPTVSERPWDLPNECEVIDRKVWSKSKERFYYKRAREKWPRRERDRVREVIKLVADEMGADHRYLWAKSIIESSGNPQAIHVLNRDFQANRVSFQQATWSEHREAQLERVMSMAGSQRREYWRAKAELARRSRYRGNPYWDVTQKVRIYGPEKERAVESPSVWSWGYGLYGMNAVGFTAYWDRHAPPWILCADDGIVATVIEIWALRRGMQNCLSQGYSNTWDTANRRISRGHCEEHTPGKIWVRWAAELGIDRSSPPRLGTKWPRKTSDRQVLLEHMRRRVEEECLTEALFHKRACTDPKAQGYLRVPIDGERELVVAGS